MSLINTSSFQADLLPIVKKWFGDAYADYPTLYDKFLAVEKSDAAFDVEAVITGMGTLQVKNEGNRLTMDTSKQEYTPRFLNVSYALGFEITKEMMDDGIAMKSAKRFTEQLKRAAMQTDEIVAAQMINNATSSTVLQPGGDQVCLISASHPTRNGLQSNTLAVNADLSEAAIEQMYINIKRATDNRGLRIALHPDKLLISPELEPTANRILKSELRVATADNDMNFIRTSGMFPGGIIVNPFLTSAVQWQIITDCPDGLKFKDRQAAEIDNDNEFSTKNALFSIMRRFNVGWSDFRGIFGAAGV